MSNNKPPINLKPKHHLIIHLAAAGKSTSQIAAEVGLTASRVSTLINTDEFKTIIEETRERLWESNAKATIERILPKAISEAEKILNDPEAQPYLKANVAFRFIDRSMGKPVQQVNTSNTTFIDLVKELERLKMNGQLDEFRSEKDEIDAILDEIIEPMVVGKRKPEYHS